MREGGGREMVDQDTHTYLSVLIHLRICVLRARALTHTHTHIHVHAHTRAHTHTTHTHTCQNTVALRARVTPLSPGPILVCVREIHTCMRETERDRERQREIPPYVSLCERDSGI